jgi:hypothetical protein
MLSSIAAKAAVEKTIREATEKTLKEATAKAAKEAAEKVAKEAAEKVAKEAAEKTIREATEKTLKEATAKAAKEAGDKIAKEAAEKVAREAAEKTIREATEKTLKEAAEKAGKEAAEKAGKEAAEKAAKEAAEKAAKEAAEKASKSLTLTQKLKKGAILTAGGLAILGLGLEADRVFKKSKESFDKRNEKQFQVSKINSTTTEMTITFSNPDNLKIYAEEIVELINVFPQINDKYTVLKQVDNTTVTVVFSKPVYNSSDIKAGTMKLYADQKNDVNEVIKEDLNKAMEVVHGALGSALCTTISSFGLEPYVGYAVNGAYWALFIIILMILIKFLQLISLVFGEHAVVKIVSGIIMAGILYGTHLYASPYFVLKC